MNIQYPRRLADGGALVDQAPRDNDLLGGQLWRPAESHAARPRRGAAGAGALMDERALEFGDAGEYGQNHAAGRRGRVGPGLGQRAQARLGLFDQFGDVQQIAGRARQPIEAVHNHHIAAAEMIEQPRQFRTIAARARELLFVNPRAAGLAECGALKVEVLIVGRNPRIPDQHRRNSVANIVAKR